MPSAGIDNFRAFFVKQTFHSAAWLASPRSKRRHAAHEAIGIKDGAGEVIAEVLALRENGASVRTIAEQIGVGQAPLAGG